MKSRLLLSLALLVVFSLFSCGDDDQPSFQDIDTLTGLNLLDENGQPLGTWGSANDKASSILIYPNPNTGTVLLQVQTIPVSRAWLTPMECNKQESIDIVAQSSSLSYTIAEVEERQIESFTFDQGTLFSNIAFGDHSVGFYRMYVELANGEIQWQNLFIDPNGTNNSDPAALDAACE